MEEIPRYIKQLENGRNICNMQFTYINNHPNVNSNSLIKGHRIKRFIF